MLNLLSLLNVSASYSYDPDAFSALFSGFALIYFLVIIGVSVLMIVSLWKIYDKAGEPGWAAIVPYYNNYILFKILYGNGWKFLMLLIPFYNIYLLIKINFSLAKRFGLGAGFGFGLMFLPVIFYPILAFGDAEYEGI